MTEIKPIVATSVTKQIAEQLKESIIAGRLGRGEQLPTEIELAKAYGVSRPTIREAFKRLAAQNLIRSRRGPTGGTFVSSYAVEDASEMIVSSTMLMLSLNSVSIDDLMDVRQMMQLQCCRRLLENWSEEAAAEIDAALGRLKDPVLTDSEFCDAEVSIHRAIVSATGNRMLEYLMYGVNESLVPVMNMMIVHVRDRTEIIGHYSTLHESILNQDMAKVEVVLTHLMQYLREQITAARKARDDRKSADISALQT